MPSEVKKARFKEMFKKTKTPKSTLFESPSYLLRGRVLKHYNDPKAWHSQFYENVTNNIDEDKFKPLFKDGNMGRGNASVRQFVAIVVMKEGNRRSDEQMFEAVDFDLLVRKALVLLNLSDQTPSLDTYYLQRHRMVAYKEETGFDQMACCFKDVTKAQTVKFHVEGKSVHMDSKLIGSNIARHSRYRIRPTTLQKWARNGLEDLNPSLQKKVEAYCREDAQKTEYHSTSDEIRRHIDALGTVIYKMLVRIKASDGLLLKRVFDEQYEVSHGKVSLRDKKMVNAGSVQNPNDPDAPYRTKGDQDVWGYSVNATETNDEGGGPSLITDVEVWPATAADKDFLQQGVEGSMEVTGNLPEHINTDGAYQSDSNREFATDNLIDFVTSSLQGKPSRYDLTLADSNLTVEDKTRGKTVPVTKAGDKWRIASKGKTKYRYFTQEQVEKAMLRKMLEAIPKTELDRCNNVEAAMFQISYHARNGKTRYRGLAKHVMWACSRCMWMNFIRLMNFQTTTCQRTLLGLFWPILRCLHGHLKDIRESLLSPRHVFSGWQTTSLRAQFAFTA